MKVLITGANGYLGRHVVEAVLAKGHEVLASDFNFDNLPETVIKVTTPIFSETDQLFEALGSPDAIIHLAWRNGFVHNDDTHIEDLPAHYDFLKKMIDAGVGQLAIMGSMHEVGYHEGAVVAETPTNPTSLYGIAKNALRQAVDVIAKDATTTIQWMRAYYIMGDDEKSNSIFAKIVKAEKEGQAEFPFTTGKNKYDFIDIDELAAQIAAVISQKEVAGIINVSSGEPISLADKVESFIKDNNFDIKLKYGVFPDRPYDSPAIWGDNQKITEILENQ